ncbi:unnamed protein product [Paramecium octaurelia]|uniref:Kinesin motor domain-containing protein n=1 Tax=Paramecium octaurelia TaxID=43137 RepID=A0A8S1T5U6_PAROT|nr:unnamed protein product [Paramecium octaurelia]
MKINQPFQVFVRIRSHSDSTNPIEVVNENILRISNREMSFQKIFTENDSNLSVYEGTLSKFISKIFEGFNMTVLCYGMTGSGKTHTMFGNSQDHYGIVYQAVKELFQLKKNGFIKISFYEIYNEQIIDLLDQSSQNLQVQEDKNGDTQIPGLSQQCIVDEDHLVQLIQQAQKRRQLASTASNQYSSRSHAIVQIQVVNYDEKKNIKYDGKLILADLAGSERCYNYKNGGTQKIQQEGQNINKSLLALGQCIMMLNQSKSHIPYRNSKLTRILKQSLSGNSMTLFIACISKQYSEETENTLKYAQQACAIKTSLTQAMTSIKMEQPKRSISIEIQNLEQQLNSYFVINNGLHKNLNTLYQNVQKEQETKVIVQNVEQQIASNMRKQKLIINQIKGLIVEKENQDKSFTYRGSEVRFCDLSNKSSIISQIQPHTADQSCQTERVQDPIYFDVKHGRNNSQQTPNTIEIHKIPESKRFSNPFLSTMVQEEQTKKDILQDRTNRFKIKIK